MNHHQWRQASSNHMQPELAVAEIQHTLQGLDTSLIILLLQS